MRWQRWSFGVVGVALAVALGGCSLADAAEPAPQAPLTAMTTAPAPPQEAESSTVAATTTVDDGSGCGQRAVDAGLFNPDCAEYQGYLDPGTRAGRGPTSGELQLQYLCSIGQAPESECAAAGL